MLKGHKGQHGESKKNKQFRVHNAAIPDSPTCTWTGKKRWAGQNRVHPPAVSMNQPGGIRQNQEQKPAVNYNLCPTPLLPPLPPPVPPRSTRSYRPLLTALSSAGSQTTEAMRFCLVFLLLDSWCLSPPQPRLLFVVKGFDFYREGSFFRLFTPLEKHTIKIIKYTHQDGTLPYQK